MYRSTDGGAHWTKVLASKENPENVGAVDLALDPQQPETVYASLWATRRPPWSVYAPSNMPGGGLYKSTDSGAHWTKLGGGLPEDNFVGKIGIAVAPSNPKRLWAVVDDTGAAVARPLRAPRGCAKVRASSQAVGRGLSVRRRRCDLDPGERRAAAVGTRLVLRVGNGGPQESGQALCDQHGHLRERRCGQDLLPDQGRAGVATTITRCGSIRLTATAWF